VTGTVNMAAVLSELETLDRVALAARWVEVFECPAPRSCQATLLRCALAWHVQMQALRQSVGARKSDRTTQALRRAASSAASSLAPGTRLLREWQGQTHHVTVLAQGFEYDGKLFHSLSAISDAITGTTCSGPLFFGLHK
jgi:hypothetical protein